MNLTLWRSLCDSRQATVSERMVALIHLALSGDRSPKTVRKLLEIVYDRDDVFAVRETAVQALWWLGLSQIVNGITLPELQNTREKGTHTHENPPPAPALRVRHPPPEGGAAPSP